MSEVRTTILSEIPDGGVFKIGKYEFIKFGEENGVVAVVSKDSLFDSRFGNNNNFAESTVLQKLKEDILPEIEAYIGTENVLEFETDLLSLDGSAKHGVVKSKVSIPTFDFYRKNRVVFEKYKLGEWWWLATPDSTSEYYNDYWCLGVSPSGYVLNFNYFNIYIGVRPFWNFVSTIFVSR